MGRIRQMHAKQIVEEKKIVLADDNARARENLFGLEGRLPTGEILSC